MITINRPTRVASPASAVGKRIVTLQARAALAGAQLVQIEADDGGLTHVLTRGAFTAQFDSQRVADLESALSVFEGAARTSSLEARA